MAKETSKRLRVARFPQIQGWLKVKGGEKPHESEDVRGRQRESYIQYKKEITIIIDSLGELTAVGV